MKALFLTREYPPNVYGGAGVHVEYLSRELSSLMEVDVRCFGDQNSTSKNLHVQGYPFEDPMFANSPGKLKPALMTLRTCLQFNAEPVDADVVHCHTWYAQFGGILAKLCYGIPKVLDDPELRESMAEKGMQRARQLYSWKNIAHQVKDLYESLV